MSKKAHQYVEVAPVVVTPDLLRVATVTNEIESKLSSIESSKQSLAGLARALAGQYAMTRDRLVQSNAYYPEDAVDSKLRIGLRWDKDRRGNWQLFYIYLPDEAPPEPPSEWEQTPIASTSSLNLAKLYYLLPQLLDRIARRAEQHREELESMVGDLVSEEGQ